KAIRARRNLEAVAESQSSLIGDPNRMLAQMSPMLAALPDNQAAEAAFAVANQYVRIGQWNAAREVFLLMADRYPTPPLTTDSYRWLTRHNSSSEVRRRQELGQTWAESHTETGTAGMTPAAHKEGQVSIKGMPDSRNTVTQVSLFGNREETRRWYQS